MNRVLATYLALLLALPGRAATSAAVPAAAPSGARVSAPQPWVPQASLVGYSGDVQVQPAGQAPAAVNALPVRLSAGDRVFVGDSGDALVQMKDGSKITIGPGANFTVVEEEAGRTTLEVLTGKIWLAVSKLKGRSFLVRTPAAIASVRGTEFSVEALGASRTAVEVFGGLVSVKSRLGDEALVSASQRVDVAREAGVGKVERFEAKDDRRMPAPGEAAPAGAEKPKPRLDGPRDPNRPEGREPPKDPRGADARPAGEGFGFDPARFKDFVAGQADQSVRRDQLESSAAFNQKTELYQEGKTLVDAFGRRVRVEEYVKRPTADSFKFVSFNFREERTDFASVEVQANRALPERLSDAGNLWFSPGANAPAYWAVKQRFTMSNGGDSVQEIGVDGQPQLFTTTSEPIFDPVSNTFVFNTGAFHRTMFGNRYQIINGDQGAADDIFHGAFRPVNNGAVSGGGNTLTGLMWRTQPVKVDITDGASSRGVYWADSFVKYNATDGLAAARTAFRPSPGLAHFVTENYYFNFRDSNNNGILDFGELNDPVDPAFFHDIVERMNGFVPVAIAGAGVQSAGGDNLIFTDRDGNGAPGGADPQLAGVFNLHNAVGFARANPRDVMIADEFAIDDFGRVLPADGVDGSATLFTGRNFERRLRGTKLARDIDVVMSPNFVFASGLSESQGQKRPISSPGPKP